MDQLKTIVVNIGVIATLALVLIAGNTQYRQWSQYNKGIQRQQAGDYMGALAGYESAIHMYTPLSPLVEKAAQRLWTMAEESERGGDTQRALITYRALRSSFYADKWLFQPGEGWIKRCDGRIERLVKK